MKSHSVWLIEFFTLIDLSDEITRIVIVFIVLITHSFNFSYFQLLQLNYNSVLIWQRYYLRIKFMTKTKSLVYLFLVRNRKVRKWLWVLKMMKTMTMMLKTKKVILKLNQKRLIIPIYELFECAQNGIQHVKLFSFFFFLGKWVRLFLFVFLNIICN